MYQAVQQPRWKAAELTAELGVAAAAGSRDADEQQLQALRMRVLGLERQPYLRISVELLLDKEEEEESLQSMHDAAESSDSAAGAPQQLLLARQVSAAPRVWQWPGGLVPSWAGFIVQLKVALLVAELTGAISRLAAQQQQRQSRTAGQAADEAEQRKKEQRRLKRQMRDQQGAAAAAEVQLDAENE
jgi:hypothetical protein